jgi:hypothetical protein
LAPAFVAVFRIAPAEAAVTRFAAGADLRAAVVALVAGAALRAGPAAFAAPAALPRVVDAVFFAAGEPATAAGTFARFTAARPPPSATSDLLDRAGTPAALPPRECDTVVVLAKCVVASPRWGGAAAGIGSIGSAAGATSRGRT